MSSAESKEIKRHSENRPGPQSITFRKSEYLNFDRKFIPLIGDQLTYGALDPTPEFTREFNLSC